MTKIIKKHANNCEQKAENFPQFKQFENAVENWKCRCEIDY